jgi:Protein of unknown function (DUF3147)
MKVSFDFSALANTQWYEFGIRFVFGGAVTVIAGLLAKRFGPTIGGLFLAFPAIFPASATLVEKHEREKKQQAGIASSRRGRLAAALDARGAAMGSIGLAVFALLLWKLLPSWNAVLLFATALAVWLGTSVLIWLASKKLRARRRLATCAPSPGSRL